MKPIDDSRIEGNMDPKLRKQIAKMILEDKIYVKNHSVLMSNRDWQRNIQQMGFFWYFKLNYFQWKLKLYDSKEEYILRKLTEEFE